MNKLQNSIDLIGRCGVDPVIRTFENGVKMAKFSLATHETVIEVNGKAMKTLWHNIVAWGKKAEQIEKFVKKGQLMAINGKLINRGFTDQYGKVNRITEIQVYEVMLINPRNKAEERKLTFEQMKKIKQAQVKRLAEAHDEMNEQKKAS